MSTLNNKIDFVALISVNNANPNGDPLNGNMPRTDIDGRGEISDVCIKRKIRNRLLDMGENIFVQSDDNNVDGFASLRDRADSVGELKKEKNKDTYAKIACEKWMDVRCFGQVFAFKGGKDDGVSIPVRGPVSIHSAYSIDPVDITSMQITKSVNSETKDKKGSDTMGMKHTVDFGFYKLKGSINVQLAEKTGFSEDDAEKIREALRTLFVNDASSARPDGSMEVVKLYWFKHNCKIGQYSSAKVHRSVNVKLKGGVSQPKSFDDYEVTRTELEGLDCYECEGM